VGDGVGDSEGFAEGDFVGEPLLPVGSPVPHDDGVGPKLELGVEGAAEGVAVGLAVVGLAVGDAETVGAEEPMSSMS